MEDASGWKIVQFARSVQLGGLVLGVSCVKMDFGDPEGIHGTHIPC